MIFELPHIPINQGKLNASVYAQMTIDHYNKQLRERNIPITCLPQNKLHQNYEVELYENKNIATRECNWHDYFNLCIWVNFPQTKSAINYLHYSEMKNKTQKNRTPIENAMTLFDENGAVVLSSDVGLLNLIRQHEWKELFWERREEVIEKLRIVIIGHSLYEKFLNPYVGMTAHTALWHVEDVNADNIQIDHRLAEELNSKKYTSPKSLQPLPILGYPGWFDLNSEESFYNNTDYFRLKSKCLL